jgi:hypothetical protein
LERLRELLAYDSDTGIMVWKASTTNRVRVGSRAGTVMNAGYVHVQVDGVLYLGHRVAWLMGTGSDPGTAFIDHINRQRTDNRLANLRLAANRDADNAQNRSVHACNSSGYPGVNYMPTKGRWRAYISAGGKQVSLGSFTTRDLAIAARQAAKPLHHKFHPKDNP